MLSPPRYWSPEADVRPLSILSAGAAQSAAERIAARFTSDTGCEVQAAYGAVGAMKARVVGSEPVDVVILSAELIEELLASGHLLAGSRRDLGTIGTGVAVRAGTPLPEVSDTRSLRANLLAANRIVCPDPKFATAGKVLMRALERLGISDQVRRRQHFFPNGYAAMRSLAMSHGLREIGITQNTEILADKGVTYVGPLPDELQIKTVYAAGVAAKAQNPEIAGNFIERFAAPSARAMLKAAGYEFQD
jgi:molybdate transport system substrate-binding protein